MSDFASGKCGNLHKTIRGYTIAEIHPQKFCLVYNFFFINPSCDVLFSQRLKGHQHDKALRKCRVG